MLLATCLLLPKSESRVGRKGPCRSLYDCYTYFNFWCGLRAVRVPLPTLLLILTLQKKLVENMTREGTLADAQTDRIMRQHQKQVDKLNAQIDM